MMNSQKCVLPHFRKKNATLDCCERSEYYNHTTFDHWIYSLDILYHENGSALYDYENYLYFYDYEENVKDFGALGEKYKIRGGNVLGSPGFYTKEYLAKLRIRRFPYQSRHHTACLAGNQGLDFGIIGEMRKKN